MNTTITVNGKKLHLILGKTKKRDPEGNRSR